MFTVYISFCKLLSFTRHVYSPLSNADYTLIYFYSQLRYNPLSSGFATRQIISLRFCNPTEPAAPTVSFSCYRRVDIVTGRIEIHINWSYEYIPLIEEAVAVYNIFYNAVIDGDILVGHNIVLDPQVSSLL